MTQTVCPLTNVGQIAETFSSEEVSFVETVDPLRHASKGGHHDDDNLPHGTLNNIWRGNPVIAWAALLRIAHKHSGERQWLETIRLAGYA